MVGIELMGGGSVAARPEMGTSHGAVAQQYGFPWSSFSKDKRKEIYIFSRHSFKFSYFILATQTLTSLFLHIILSNTKLA